MIELTHEEIEELLGAYALEALPPEEMRQVEAHLRTCAAHREMAEALRETAARLAYNVPERQPSAQLRDRVLQAISREDSSGVMEEPGRPARPVVLPIERAPRALRWTSRPAMAALAAAVLLAFLGGIGIDRLTSRPAQLAWAFTGNAQAPGAVASLTYFRDRKQAVLAATGLPALPEGKLYEIWLFKNGTAVDVGTSGVAGGKLVVTLTRDLTKYQQLAITAEPGEQPHPTSSPILEGLLSGASA